MNSVFKFSLIALVLVLFTLLSFVVLSHGSLQWVIDIGDIHQEIPWCDDLYYKNDNPFNFRFNMFKVCKVS
jgi:hypothetical protein